MSCGLGSTQWSLVLLRRLLDPHTLYKSSFVSDLLSVQFIYWDFIVLFCTCDISCMSLRPGRTILLLCGSSWSFFHLCVPLLKKVFPLLNRGSAQIVKPTEVMWLTLSCINNINLIWFDVTLSGFSLLLSQLPHKSKPARIVTNIVLNIYCRRAAELQLFTLERQNETTTSFCLKFKMEEGRGDAPSTSNCQIILLPENQTS